MLLVSVKSALHRQYQVLLPTQEAAGTAGPQLQRLLTKPEQTFPLVAPGWAPFSSCLLNAVLTHLHFETQSLRWEGSLPRVSVHYFSVQPYSNFQVIGRQPSCSSHGPVTQWNPCSHLKPHEHSVYCPLLYQSAYGSSMLPPELSTTVCLLKSKSSTNHSPLTNQSRPVDHSDGSSSQVQVSALS